MSETRKLARHHLTGLKGREEGLWIDTRYRRQLQRGRLSGMSQSCYCLEVVLCRRILWLGIKNERGFIYRV
jgi:hypothetical protein